MAEEMTLRLATWLALKCKDESFRRFLHAPDEAAAIACVRAICGVTSRADIEKNPVALDRFNEFIRIPYQQHLEQEAVSINH